MAQDEAATGKVFIGVDLGSEHIRVGAVNQAGQVLAFRRAPYTAAGEDADSARSLADQLLDAVKQMIAEQSTATIGAIGVGFPGLVHQTTYRIVKLPHAPSLGNLDLYQEFEHAFRLPIAFENNANAAAFAEMSRGVARGVNDWLYLSIGTGIGAGLVLDGTLRRGKSGFAGEIGHMNIDPDGLECACGS